MDNGTNSMNIAYPDQFEISIVNSYIPWRYKQKDLRSESGTSREQHSLLLTLLAFLPSGLSSRGHLWSSAGDLRRRDHLPSVATAQEKWIRET